MQRPDPATPAPSLPEHPASPRLRVLVLGVTWPLQTFVERLVTGLVHQGLDLTMASLSSFARPPTEWSERHDIGWTDDAVPVTLGAVARALTRRDGQAAGRPRATRLLRNDEHARRALFRSGWDVIYAPWINALTDHPDLLDVPVPIVTSCRGSLVTTAPWDPARPDLRSRLTAVFEAARLVHCVSEQIVDDAAAIGLDRAKARVIRPAVSPDGFRPAAAREHRAGPVRTIAVGTLKWHKDHEHALLAIRKGLDQGADLRLDLIGDGPDRQHLQFAIDDLDLADRVCLLGRRDPDEVARRLQDADIFLHTSSTEGISNAVLEAMATGLPIVTTDAGGMREAVRHEVDGFVVRVRDAEASAAALARLATEPDLRIQMGAAARQRVIDDFQLEHQLASFAALLHEAAGS